MLKKVLRRLKNSLVTGDEFNDALKDVLAQKVSTDKKFEMLMSVADRYIKKDMAKAAKFATWENYYEKFTVNGVKNEDVLNDFLKYEYGNFLYNTLYAVADSVAKLNLTKPNQLGQQLIGFRKDAVEFRPTAFYIGDTDYRRQQLIKAGYLAKEIGDYCGAKKLSRSRTASGVLCAE